MAGRAAECDLSRGVVRRLWAADVPYGQALKDPLHRKVLFGAVTRTNAVSTKTMVRLDLVMLSSFSYRLPFQPGT